MLEIFTKGDSQANKMKFERACALDIEEAVKGKLFEGVK